VSYTSVQLLPEEKMGEFWDPSKTFNSIICTFCTLTTTATTVAANTSTAAAAAAAAAVVINPPAFFLRQQIIPMLI
jgi:hypothetical protein